MHLASGDVNIGRNTGAHIEQGVQLDGAFVPAKLRPGKKFQAQIDGGGIEGVDRVGELDAQGFVAIEFASGADQAPREIGKDAPVAVFVGIGQGAARNPAADAHVVELELLHPQTSLDVAQTLAIGELGEGQTEKLVERRKALHLVIALIAIHAAMELGKRHQVHELRENRPAGIHKPFLRCLWNGQRVPATSNRFRSSSFANSCQYLT